MKLCPCLLPVALLLATATPWAAPFTPSADSQVLDRVLPRAGTGAGAELQALRAAWRANPADLPTATRLAWRYQAEVAATGDPRYMGYIEAALKPWWGLAEPPVDVRVLRAVVLQFDHRFDPALADLRAALTAAPTHPQALAWQLAIQLVLADLPAARASCERLAGEASPLLGQACRAQLMALSGQAGAATSLLLAALAGSTDAAEQQWALTRLAEIESWRGNAAGAQATFARALALGLPDVYLEAAHADHLLDQGRPAEVLARLSALKDGERADVLLLRLALAAKAAGDPRAGAYQRSLQARFEAAGLRGDTSHRKEQARALLVLQGDSAQALKLAQLNWADQREPADARLLLEAALAARNKAAAEPVQRWLAQTGFEGVIHRRLAAQLKALP
jgi:hypothetical protein